MQADDIVLQIRSIDGTTALVGLDTLDITVASLKQIIYAASQGDDDQATRIDASEPPYQRLIFRGRELLDQTTLASNELQHDDVIHLVNRPDMPPRSTPVGDPPAGATVVTEQQTFEIHGVQGNGNSVEAFGDERAALERVVEGALTAARVPAEAAARGAVAAAATSLSSSAWSVRRTIGRYGLVQQLRSDVDTLIGDREHGSRENALLARRSQSNADRSRPNLIAETQALAQYVGEELNSLSASVLSVSENLGAVETHSRTSSDITRIRLLSQCLSSVRFALELMRDWPENEPADPLPDTTPSIHHQSSARNNGQPEGPQLTQFQTVFGGMPVYVTAGVGAELPEGIRQMMQTAANAFGHTSTTTPSPRAAGAPENPSATVPVEPSDQAPAPQSSSEPLNEETDRTGNQNANEGQSQEDNGHRARGAIDVMAREVQRSIAISRGEIPGDPQNDLPSLYDIVRSGTNIWEGTTDEALNDDNGFEELVKLVTSDITIPEALGLYSGDWTCLRRVRALVRTFIYQRIFERPEDSGDPTEEDLTHIASALFEDKVVAVCKEIDEDVNIIPLKKERNPPHTVGEVVSKWLPKRMTELFSFWLAPAEVSDEDFPDRLKVWVDSAFGELFYEVSEILNGGLQDTRHVVHSLCGTHSDEIGSEAMRLFSPTIEHLFTLASNSATRWRLRLHVSANPYPMAPPDQQYPVPEIARSASADTPTDFDALAAELAEEEEADRLAMEMAMEMAEEESTDEAPAASIPAMTSIQTAPAPSSGDVFDSFLSPREAFQWRKRIATDTDRQNRMSTAPLSRAYRQGGGSLPPPPAELTDATAEAMAVESLKRACNGRRVGAEAVEAVVRDMTAAGREDGRSIASEYADEVSKSLTARVARDPDFSSGRYGNTARRFR